MALFNSLRYRSFCIIILLGTLSCGSIRTNNYPSKSNHIITYAKSFLGTPYQYGGTTTSGMDCSGLIHQSFLRYGIEIPRTSRNMSKMGKKIQLKKIKKGDLLFFKTSKKWFGDINHVGLVVMVNGKDIKFIHSSTSQGVIISPLRKKYWFKNFKFARRVL